MSFLSGTEDDQFSSWTSPIFTNQVFGTREEMMDWVKTTEYSLGYVLVTQRSKKYTNGFIWKVHLMCNHGGKYDGPESSICTSTKKTDCPFRLIGQYSTMHGYWTIRVVCDQHNHLPIEHLEGDAYARRLSDDEYRLVEDLTWKNVRPREILSTLKDQNDNNLSTLQTIYDAQHKIRKVENAGKTPMQVLMSLLYINRYVYEASVNPVTNELQALFFVHPTSYEIWRAFPHVLIIDATYKTNIYNMPFVQIVGVTSTGKTFCIAFIFISEEKIENYKWALEQLKLTLNECMIPHVIVTDRELALMKACEIVFPHANHLLCRWHIGQNIWKNCRKYNCLDKYNWLDKYKKYFVSASIDQSLNFGNRTSNRVESQHAKFKDYMTCHSYTLDKFIVCVDKIVKSQLTAIRQSFGKSEISHYHKYNIPCFSLLLGVVSNEALDLMVKEIDRSNGFQLDSSTCGCQLYNSCGLPCACKLSSYVNSGDCIPLYVIDIFWRTLNLSPETSFQCDNIRCDSEVNQFKEHFNKQSEPRKRSFLRKLVDIFNPTKTTMKPPTVKRNTRGRPSLKKQQQQQRHAHLKSKDPQVQTEEPGKHGMFVDLNEEPGRHSMFVDLNEEPGRHSMFVDLNEEPVTNPLLDHIPNIFHRYIKSFNNVKGDGNCGFRAIAVGLGRDENMCLLIRQELLQELRYHEQDYTKIFTSVGFNYVWNTVDFWGTGIAPMDKWMSMPHTGLVIASFYRRPVVFISMAGSSTCFPLWSGPHESESTSPIVVARVGGIHFINLSLREGCPIPSIHPQWRRYRIDRASTWEEIY